MQLQFNKMSLLGSIFGSGGGATDDDKVSKKKRGKEKSKEASNTGSLTGLFAKSAELPEPPKHIPKPRKEKRKEADTKEIGNKEEAESPKKRRKPRKQPNEDTTTTSGKDETKTTPEEISKSKETEDADNVNNDNDNKDNSNDGDDEDAEARTIFVGNLPLQGTTRKSLAALFKDCGAVESTRIRSVPVKGIKLPPQRAGDQNLVKKVCVNTNQIDYDNSPKETVQGYVVFKQEESVSKALELNNTLMVGGRRIRVDRASPSIEPARSVFCGNLPYGADEGTLQEHFIKGCDFKDGDVEGVRIVRDKETYLCKGFGYVLLKDKSMVPTALKLHESMYMNKSIRVLVCGKRFKNKKGNDGRTPIKIVATEITGTVRAPDEKISTGALRRVLAKQSKEAAKLNKRKRGEKKKTTAVKKGGPVGVSKRAALDKKVEQRVKKIQKRISKGMGKTRK